MCSARITATDPNGDALSYTWALLAQPLLPTDHTTYPPVPFGLGTANPSNTASSIFFYAPSAPGPHRCASGFKTAAAPLQFGLTARPLPLSVLLTCFQPVFVNTTSAHCAPAALLCTSLITRARWPPPHCPSWS